MARVTYDKQLTALLVIDPYNDFISEGGKIWNRIKAVAEANSCVPHMAQVLNAARQAGLRVFYTLHHRYRPGDYETWKYIAPILKAAWSSRRINAMNNNGWQQARREAGLPLVRVHDLRHSFGCRLRAAGGCAEDREALLGHANHSMAGHYASADVGHLLKLANLLLDRRGTRTLLRVADDQRGRGDARSHTVPQQERSTWFCAPNA